MQISSSPETVAELKSPSIAASSSDRFDALYTILTCLGILTAAIVRWHGIGKQSLWWDEGYTLWISQFSPRDIWHGVATDTSPPLYYLLEHFWIRLFGVSDAALRGMSAFFETLALPVFYLLARRILANQAAVAISIWLYAVCAFQVEYAQEARFYGMLSFFFLVCIYSLIAFLEKRSIVWFSLVVISLTAALYTHNMALFYLPGIALLWLFYPTAQSILKRVFDGVLCASIALLLYAPWIPHLLSQTKAVSQSFWISRPTAGRLVDTICTLSGLSVGILQPLFARVFRIPSLLTEQIVAVLLLAALLTLICGGLLRVLPQHQKKTAALLGYALVPILLAFFYSLHSSPVFINRGFIASSTVIPILLATAIAFQGIHLRKIFATIALLLLVLTGISLMGFIRYSRKEDWRGVTEYVEKNRDGHRLLLFVPSQGQVLFDHYANTFEGGLARESEEGIPETFDYVHPYLRSTADYSDDALIIPLQKAVEAERYEEISLVLSHASQRIRSRLLDYLAKHCTEIHNVAFFELEVKRCTLQPTK